MALERRGVEAALAAFVDEANAVPRHIADRYDEYAGHPLAVMMSHPDIGRLLAALTAASGGRSVLEIGTFVGISAAWMEQGLHPDGYIDTLELDEEVARETTAWLASVGLGDRVTVHVGPALETLERLPDSSYDMCWVDADKTGYPDYLEHAIRLVRPGGMILADNVFGGGDVADHSNEEPRVRALRAYTAAAVARSELLTTVIPIADGVALSVRLGPS